MSTVRRTARTFSAASYAGSPYYNGQTAEYISEKIPGRSLRWHNHQEFSGAGAKHGSSWADMGNLPYDVYRIVGNGYTIMDTNGGPVDDQTVNTYPRYCS